MPRFGFRARLFAVTMASIMVVLGAGYWYLRTTTEAAMLQSLERELVVRVQLVETSVNREAGETPPTLEHAAKWDALVDHLGQVAAARTTLVSKDGVVLGDSDVPLERLASVDNHGARPEVSTALHGGLGVAQRLSSTLSVPLIYVATQWEKDGVVLGVVRVALPATELDAAVDALTKGLTISFGVALLIALLVSTVAAQLTSASARSLTQIALRMSGGDLTVRSSWAGTDEFAVLGQALDGLAQNLSVTLEQLKGERDRLERVLRSMVEGVVLMDEAGKIVLYNRAVIEMLYLNSGILGRRATEVIKLDGFEEMLTGALNGDNSFRELKAIEPKAKVLLTSVRRLARRKGALAVFVDVTEQRHLETVRQEFVANASHELRTPVAAILSAVETLQDGAASDAEILQSFLGMIDRNAHRLRSLVDDLLTLSQIESGRLEVMPKPVALRPAIEDVFKNLTPQARAKETELVCRVPTNLRVMATEAGIEHVFGNLVDNAIKYCPARATVTVAAKTLDGVVAITVTDTGPGIEPAHRERIFERFYRVDAGRSREVGGTGLGLSIVKHWVEAMDGTVRAEAAPGGGTRFRIALNDAEVAGGDPASARA
jgi:two-component system, OmpR family, phosphate regulon sensor histidine kinase PhoR